MRGSSGKLFPVLASIIRLLLCGLSASALVTRPVYLLPRGDVNIRPRSSARKQLLMRYNSGTVAVTTASHPKCTATHEIGRCMSDPSTFRIWLKRRRTERGLTQEDLGEL